MMPPKIIRIGCTSTIMARYMAAKPNSVKPSNLIDAALTPKLEKA
jgi:hypothetical protein